VGTLRLVPSSGSISKRFLLHALRTRTVRDVFEEDATGTSDSMRNLSQGKNRSAPIPLPPQEEADLLALRVAGVMEQRKRSLRQLEDVEDQLSTLARAVLAKAFHGELVPQDPNDEPAEVMLARSQAPPRNASADFARKRQTAEVLDG
jgi:type I restriction enzyme, S subunit